MAIEILEQSLRSIFISLQVNGVDLATGTGFILKAKSCYVLVTNRHNVTGEDNNTGFALSTSLQVPDSIVISHNSKAGIGTWVNRKENLYASGKPLWYEHPTLKDKADFVALPLTQLDDVAFYPYDLNQKNNMVIKPTDVVSVVGFPFGLTVGGRLGIWATGFISSEPEVDYQDLPIFLIDCRTRKGQSGSPVIAHRNPGAPYYNGNNVKMVTGGSVTDFLGIYSGRVNEQSDLGMVWKASAIRELLDIV